MINSSTFIKQEVGFYYADTALHHPKVVCCSHDVAPSDHEDILEPRMMTMTYLLLLFVQL
jgi:hypothetical protein